jgi:hypothetical protein
LKAGRTPPRFFWGFGRKSRERGRGTAERSRPFPTGRCVIPRRSGSSLRRGGSYPPARPAFSVGNGLDRSAGFWGCGVVSPCRGGEPPGVAWRYSAACPSLRGPILSARAERIGRKARQREGLCTKPPFPLESHPPKFGGRVRFADYRARARPPAVPRNRTRSGMSVCVFGGASRIAGRILSARVTSSPVPVGAGLDPPAVTPSFFAERSRPFPTADAKFHSPPPRFPTHITIARHGRRPGTRTVMGEARICNKLRRMGIQREGRLCKKPFPLACLSSDSFRTSGKNRPPEGRTSRQIPPG